MGGPKPGNVYDYDHNDPRKGYFFREAKFDAELGELEIVLRTNDSENNWNFYRLNLFKTTQKQLPHQ